MTPSTKRPRIRFRLTISRSRSRRRAPNLRATWTILQVNSDVFLRVFSRIGARWSGSVPARRAATSSGRICPGVSRPIR